MRVGIDITGMFWKYRTGVQNLYYGLIEGLAGLKEETSDFQFVLIDRSLQETHTLPIELDARFEFRSPGIIQFLPASDQLAENRLLGPAARAWNRGARSAARHLSGWQGRVNQILADIDILEGWDVWIRTAEKAKRIIVLPDIIPVTFPELYPPDILRNARRSLEFARVEADCLIAISRHAKRTFVEQIGIPPEKIRVIYPGVRKLFTPISQSVVRPVLIRYGIPDEPYVLSIGYLDPRKNIQGHVRAFQRLANQSEFRELRFVLVGPESLATTDVMREVSNVPVRNRIHITGYVPESDLAAILSGARALAYCSFYEGFGFPVLEAMACGVPVVASNVTSIPEISGGAAILVNPHQPDEITDALSRVLLDNNLRLELRVKGLARIQEFTSEKWARGHLDVYREFYVN